ncbi:MAG: hypothetical protein HY275_18075 [Gemmatimonadetes bacterium]|nr:hypothetical protein [Gemmatimonadota bacterium]
MTRIDPHCWIGGYPWRHLPSTDADALRAALERERFDGAWVGHLPSAWHRDPSPGNVELYRQLLPHRGVLAPSPTIRPDWPHWGDELARALDEGAQAVRAYPTLVGMGPDHPAWLELGAATAESGLVLVLTQRFEDLRQRHPLDAAGDLTPAHVRALARGTLAHVIVGSPSRAMVEEVHFGLTASERARVWFDTAWLWGPPDDELAHLLRTVGAERFVEGSGWPLRLPEQLRAARDLLPSDVADPAFARPTALVQAVRERRR